MGVPGRKGACREAAGVAFAALLALLGACAADDGVLGTAVVTDAKDAGHADGADGVAEATVGPGATLSGTVALTGPVSDAVIEVWSLGAGLVPVGVVAKGTTDDDGAFVITVPEGVPDAWVEVRVSGTKASYPVGEGSEKFDWDDWLATHIELNGGKAITRISVNGWTTLAVRLARAYAANSDHSDAAVALASERIGAHLWRPDKHPLWRITSLLPGEADATDATAAVALTHLGLHGIAARWTPDAAGPVKVVDVVTALGQDLSNGIFDGLWPAADGSVVPVEVTGSKPLTADTTRWELASAIYGQTAAGVDQAPLLATDGLYENLALDDGLLYPPFPKPHRFDPLAPLVEWQPPTPGANDVLASGLVLRARAQDDGGIAESWGTVTSGGEERALALQTLSSEPGVAVVEADVALEELDDGALELRVHARDPDGNVGEAVRTVHLDRTAPLVTMQAPSGEATTDAVATAMGTSTDPEPAEGLAAGVESVEVLLDGAPLVVQRTGAQWTTTGTYAAPGVHAWVVRATDAVGNQAQIDREVLYDPDPPALTVDVPSGDGWVTTAQVQIAGVVTDAGAGVKSVTAREKGDADAVAAAVGPDGAWAATLDGIEDGTRTIVARAEDALGSWVEVQRTFGLDTTPPKVVVAPGIDGAWHAGPTLTLEGTASDATSGVASVWIEAGADPVDATLQPGATGAWLATVPFDAAAGTVDLQVFARDAAGLLSAGVTVTVKGDADPPALQLLTPAPDLLWTNSGTVAVNGTATDAKSGVATVTVQADDQPPFAAVLAEAGAGTWSWSRDVTLQDTAGKPADGTHIIRV